IHSVVVAEVADLRRATDAGHARGGARRGAFAAARVRAREDLAPRAREAVVDLTVEVVVDAVADLFRDAGEVREAVRAARLGAREAGAGGARARALGRADDHVVADVVDAA